MGVLDDDQSVFSHSCELSPRVLTNAESSCIRRVLEYSLQRSNSQSLLKRRLETTGVYLFDNFAQRLAGYDRLEGPPDGIHGHLIIGRNESCLPCDWLSESLMEVNSLHDLTRIVNEFPVVAKDNAADSLSLFGLQSLTAGDTLRQFDGFLSGPVLIHNGCDDAAEVIEVEFATLARHDLDASVSQQSPMDHDVEDILAGHAALLREQYSLELATLGILEQPFEFRAVGRFGASQSVVFIPRQNPVAQSLNQLLNVTPLTSRTVFLLVGTHADIAHRWLQVHHVPFPSFGTNQGGDVAAPEAHTYLDVAVSIHFCMGVVLDRLAKTGAVVFFMFNCGSIDSGTRTATLNALRGWCGQVCWF